MEFVLMAGYFFFFSLAAVLVACGGGGGNKAKPVVVDRPPTRTSHSSGQSKSAVSQVQPKKAVLNEKEKMIKAGLKTGKNAYPTVDDVPSDWSDSKKKKKEGAEKKDGDKEKKDETPSSGADAAKQSPDTSKV